jgi:hypothetical protein
MYGYDALMLLGQAVNICIEKELSRACISKVLANTRRFNGACLPYVFKDGETVSSRYTIYKCIRNSDGRRTEYIVAAEITPDGALVSSESQP